MKIKYAPLEKLASRLFVYIIDSNLGNKINFNK